MAIAFYAEDTKLPAIKKRAVGNWVKEVAATYGKKVGDISYIWGTRAHGGQRKQSPGDIAGGMPGKSTFPVKRNVWSRFLLRMLLKRLYDMCA